MQTIKKFLDFVRHGMQTIAPMRSSDQPALSGQLVFILETSRISIKDWIPVWPKWARWPDLYPVGTQWQGIRLPLTNHSDQAGLYHVLVYGMEAEWTVNRSLPSRPASKKKAWQRLRSPISSQGFEVDLKDCSRTLTNCLPHLVWNGQDWSGLVSWRHLDISTALSGSKTQGKWAISPYMAIRKAKDN